MSRAKQIGHAELFLLAIWQGIWLIVRNFYSVKKNLGHVKALK